tara:strand:+ start:2098 stop:2724 length:627 start_codon:yes stop_codon:yes gene_type:complete
LDTYTLNPEYSVLFRAFYASRSFRAKTSGGDRFVRNDAGNFQLSNEAFVALWQNCKGTDQLKKQYEARISGFLSLIEGELEQSFNSMLTAAKAVVYDWSRNDEHVVVKRESHERYLRRCKYESATHWLERYDHANGFAQLKQYLAERAVYGGAWGFTQAFQTTKSLQSRASRLRKKGVNLRHHERAGVQGSARTNYAALNAYANSLVM